MWTNESFKIGKLNIVIVVRVIISYLFGIVEDLHAEYAEDEEKEGEEKKKTNYYRHYL